jgi:hypothetical protein
MRRAEGRGSFWNVSKHIKRIGNAYYARVVIPVDVRPVLGKSEFKVPLGGDFARARRKVGAVVTDI